MVVIGLVVGVLVLRGRPTASATSVTDLTPTSAETANEAYPVPVVDSSQTAVVFAPVSTTTGGALGYVSPEIAAESRYRSWVARLSNEELAAVGLSRETATRAVTLGDPVAVYFLSLDILTSFDPTTFDNDSLYRELTNYKYPVMHGDRGVGMLRIDYVEGMWVAVTLGETGLAKQLGIIQRARGALPRNAKLLVFPEASIRVLVLDGEPAEAVLLASGRTPYLDDLERLDLERTNVPTYPLEMILARLQEVGRYQRSGMPTPTGVPAP